MKPDPTYRGLYGPLSICSRCGCGVVDVAQHNRWHRDLERIDVDARRALASAVGHARV